MADTKISALTVATTPLVGTEVLPIVQSGVTKQVSVADLTAGRAVSALSLSLTNALTAANGGTGQSSYAIGDLLYASGTTALSKLADVATGNALISGGVGVAPSWGKVGLTTHISGTLAVGNGGTGLTSLAAGYIPYGNGSSALNSTANFTYSATGWLSDSAMSINGSSAASVVLTCGGAYSGAGIRVASNGYAYVFAGGSDVMGFSAGNMVQLTASKGINFTANTGAAGKTSQLLNWYEEGTWTPTITRDTPPTLTYTAQVGKYVRIGRQVTLNGSLFYTVTSSGGGLVYINGLPFTSNSTSSYSASGSVGYCDSLSTGADAIYVGASSTVCVVAVNGGFAGGTLVSGRLYFTITYQV